MNKRQELEMMPQPDNFTCGPTCLHAVLRYYGDQSTLNEIIDETPRLENGGTLGVMLAHQAILRGYQATIFTYNLKIFDPTWFATPDTNFITKLKEQAAIKRDARVREATKAYMAYLEAGGVLRFDDLTRKLIRRYLNRGIPILTGLSATYLYRTAREYEPEDAFDDLRGEPAGHFVVLCGYDRETKNVLVADPMDPNPMAKSRLYSLSIDRLICAILLGVLTYDANLLIIQPAQDV